LIDIFDPMYMVVSGQHTSPRAAASPCLQFQSRQPVNRPSLPLPIRRSNSSGGNAKCVRSTVFSSRKLP
jgi:hypothetical protein